MNRKQRMHELVEVLNRARRAYEQEDREVMSNYEYDKLYDELEQLEKELGVTLASSPTISVGYEVLSELQKERHARPMLSLDKTKEVAQLQAFLGNQTGILSWKLDGLTVVLTYQDGRLQKAVTRGNGEIGEVITANAKTFQNLPLRIPYQGELVIRGEAVIRYSDFEEINAGIADIEQRYKNPRNLCSGSVRQLSSEITAQRKVRFLAFSLVQAADVAFENSREKQLAWLTKQGFEVVEHHMVTSATVEQEVAQFAQAIATYDLPSDGLVLTYDDIAYGQSLGQTAKFPRDSFAYKWADETKETTLREIEWSPSRTGLINPVAIFDPVELEGTSVARASVHNLSILEDLQLGIGDQITVYKANMIIPQIAENRTRSGSVEIPQHCPACHAQTQVICEHETKTLYCPNPECSAKRMKSFALFASRDALNIEGLSEATLEKFIAHGFLQDYVDLFHLSRYETEIQSLEGFGKKSYEKLQKSVEQARQTTLPKLLYGLGIANIGLANAKMICKEVGNDPIKLPSLTQQELSEIAGIGEVIAGAYVAYFAKESNRVLFERLLQEVSLQQEEQSVQQTFAGMNFVITGSVHHFANRNEVKEVIEARGGKVTGSVTKKTNYLINNEIESTSSKNQKARELNIPILSEEQFLELLGE